MTKICMLTTWSSVCGIAEYSRHLVDEFVNMGHNILLLTNKWDESIAPITIVETFGVHLWKEDPRFNLKKVEKALQEFKPDVFCVQYQNSLYQVVGFNSLLEMIECPKVIVRHDTSFNPGHNFKAFQAVIAHNKVVPNTHYIPMPTTDTLPMVFSFGMGRNDYAFIDAACAEIGVSFWGHDAQKNGWMDENKLFEAMNQADAIVLWYSEVPLQGQSAALRTAISSHRPVIVNDVGWFADAPYFVHKASSKQQLQDMLKEALHLNYIRDNSYENCAEKYLEVFNEIE